MTPGDIGLVKKTLLEAEQLLKLRFQMATHRKAKPLPTTPTTQCSVCVDLLKFVVITFQICCMEHPPPRLLTVA